MNPAQIIPIKTDSEEENFDKVISATREEANNKPAIVLKRFMCFVLGHYYLENGHYCTPFNEVWQATEYSNKPYIGIFKCKRCKRHYKYD